MPRLVRELFAELGAAGGGKEVRYNYVQLYNEEFLDLLAPGGGGGPLRLVEDSADPSAFMQVQGAAELTAAGADDLLQRVAAGAELRASSATNMNDASSRSHAVLMVKLVAAGAAAGAKGTVFSIVDLAGSERVNRSGAVPTGGGGAVDAEPCHYGCCWPRDRNAPGAAGAPVECGERWEDTLAVAEHGERAA